MDLESFSEGVILHQCGKRYESGKIYTFVGTILVAVNPFKRLDIYGPEVIEKFRHASTSSEAIEPHVYAISSLALQHLKSDRMSQSVLISGESGAGKTETTKKILEYLAVVAGKDERRSSTVNVAQQILQSNPVLESFGNAKTGRNNNSSRFGKWMELNFTSSSKIKGCKIVNYLLEKSRITFQLPNERNYHVFYMLLTDAKLKGALQLGDASNYFYLNQSGCETVAGRDDSQELKEMMQAFNNLEFAKKQQDEIFKCLAGILNLGNVKFQPAGNDTVEVANASFLVQACDLLGLNQAEIAKALCFRKMESREGVIQIPLDQTKAENQRDALAKEIYYQIFDSLVRKVNEAIYKGPGDDDLSIGVLDIYGFELFETNSFEQLCINYANEKLQYFFNKVIFEGEMQMYKAEGISCDKITFQDNQECLDLIEKKTVGILAKLDEELVVPNGSDQKFCDKCHSAFSNHPFYKKSLKAPNDFIVRHFAGEVVYRSDNFMEKNKDTLAEVLTNSLEHSNNGLVKSIFTYSKEHSMASSPTMRSGGPTTKKVTIAKSFKNNLDTLMTALNSTAPHFIRCVKSNSSQKPMVFEAPLCLRQLKYAGLFEAIRIRKSGYAYRFPHDYFVRKYYLCCSRGQGLNDRQYAEAIMEDIEAQSNGTIDRDDWAVGNSKVFIKTRKPRIVMEEIRNRAIEQHVVILQSFFRMGLAKIHTFAAKYEQIKLKKEELRKKRELEEKRKEEALKRKAEREAREAAERARKEKAEEERKEKERVEREEKEKLLKSVSLIQGVCRMFHAKRASKVMRMAKTLHNAILCRDEHVLSSAIKAGKKLSSINRKIKSLIERANGVLGEVYEEQDLKADILLAIEENNIDELRRVLEMAKGRKMMEEPEAKHAKKLLEELLHRDAAIERLELLTCMGNQNAVLENADELREAIDEALKYGVEARIVGKAEKFYDKVSTLLPIRNKMRMAVELASRKMILESLEERKEFCRTHGNEFCKEEQVAMKQMLRMFSYEVQLKGGENITPPDGDADASEFDDIRLPKWAFEQMLTIQDAEDEKLKNLELKAMERRLGNDYEKMREVRRAFKWVVHYSTWRHPDHEEMIEKKYSTGTFTSQNPEEANMYDGQSKFRKARSGGNKTPKKGKQGLMSGTALRDKSIKKEAIPRQSTKAKSSGYGQGRTKIGVKKTAVPKSERKLQEMMKEYSAFYDTHRIPLDWCP